MLQEIERLLVESDLMEAGGDTENAVQRAQQALQQARQVNAEALIAQAQIKLAKVLARTGEYAKARQITDEILAVERSDWIAVEALIVQGDCGSEADEINAAENLYHRAADLSREIGYSRGLATALQDLALFVYRTRGHFDLALTILEEAANIWQTNGFELPWVISYTRAYIYNVLGDNSSIRAALDELLPMVKPATRIAGAYYFLWARLSLDEEEFDKAKEYLRLALRIATHTGSPDLSIMVRVEYSRYFRLTGDPAVARSWAEDAARYAQRTRHSYYFGVSLIEGALACWEAGDVETAETSLVEARQFLQECGAAYELARTAFFLSSFYQKLKRPQANKAWLEACDHVLKDGFAFILERERSTAFPLVAAYLRSRNARAQVVAEQMLQQLSRVAPPPLRINGLGQFIVWQSRRRIPDQAWNRRKSGELCRFLLLNPNHGAGREEVLDGLWPDSSPSTALAQFHQATSTLRHILEPDLPDKFPSRYLLVEGERVSLYLPPGTVVDFERFEQALPIAMRSGNIDDLEQALAMYTGEIFPMDRYSDWSASRRKSLEELYLRGLLALGQAYMEQQQFFKALDCSRRILHLDAWNEDAVLLGMQAYVQMRDVPRAMRLYLDLQQTLDSELGLTPRSDLRTLAEELRKR